MRSSCKDCKHIMRYNIDDPCDSCIDGSEFECVRETIRISLPAYNIIKVLNDISKIEQGEK